MKTINSNTHCRILAIDDDQLMAKVYQKILPKSGEIVKTEVLGTQEYFSFEFNSALNGKEGLELVKQGLQENSPYAVIYLDMKMPGWDGITTAEKIREIDPTVMIIWITAFDDHKHSETRQRIGSNFEILAKPVDQNELLELTYIFCCHWERARNSASNLIEQSRADTVKAYAIRSAGHPTRIMFVDDSATVRAVYGELLRQQPHYEVAVAGSLTEALELSYTFVPDISILDYYMPGGNGDMLARALLSQPVTRNTLILVLTHKEEVEKVMLEAGAVDVLYKDDPTEVFLQRIHSIERYIRLQIDLRRTIEVQAQTEITRKQERIEQDNQLAYQSGLTEMSSNVLHNIGNAIAGMGWQVLALQKSINKIQGLKQGLESGLNVEDLEILQTGLKQATVDLTHIYGEELTECGQNLTRSIEYIGEVIRVQQSLTQVGAIYLRNFLVSEVIEDALLIEKETNRKYNITTHTTINSKIKQLSLPYNQFMQLLGNLIKNSREAIHEAREVRTLAESVEGVIEIRVEQARQEDHLRLTVEDNGCGIEASRLTTIFQRGESSKKSGSGFGLHSVATFVQSLNGSIRAESEGEGLGSAIIIEMPING